jgi:hypothetical protein
MWVLAVVGSIVRCGDQYVDSDEVLFITELYMCLDGGNVGTLVLVSGGDE